MPLNLCRFKEIEAVFELRALEVIRREANESRNSSQVDDPDYTAEKCVREAERCRDRYVSMMLVCRVRYYIQ